MTVTNDKQSPIFVLNQYHVQKNDQNSLKGLVWWTGGNVLSLGALTLTAATVAGVGAAALSTLGIMVNDYARNSLGGVTVPMIGGLAFSAVVLDYLAVKFTAYCFSNAIHHLGPEYQILKQR